MTLTSFQRHGSTRARGSASLCVIWHKVWHTRWHNVEFGYALSSILGNQVGVDLQRQSYVAVMEQHSCHGAWQK